jgi:hypothetical protein
VPGFGLSSIHGLVSGAICTVNPFITATVQRSAGRVIAPGGVETPSYTTFSISCQAQALQYSDIIQLDGLQIQGVRRKIYIAGYTEGLIRDKQQGGDVITFPNGTFPEGNVWLVALVLEAWSQSGWCSAAITLQNGS